MRLNAAECGVGVCGDRLAELAAGEAERRGAAVTSDSGSAAVVAASEQRPAAAPVPDGPDRPVAAALPPRRAEPRRRIPGSLAVKNGLWSSLASLTATTPLREMEANRPRIQLDLPGVAPLKVKKGG